jgi:hypothetical protein
MHLKPTTRRSFLSSIGILSTGAAFGSTFKYLVVENNTTDLQQIWDTFRKQAGGEIFHHTAQSHAENFGRRCKGHRYQEGEIVYFSQQNVLAQPTWVYWDNKKGKPSDVLITFFENNHSHSRIIVLNRFEIETLRLLSKENRSSELVSLVCSTARQKNTIDDISNEMLSIKIVVKNDGQVQSTAGIKGQDFFSEKKLILNV